MHICGASCHWGKKDASETGILMELQLENKYLNDSYNYSIWDGVLWSNVLKTENLDSYMNTAMYAVDSDGKKIRSVECYQMNTEKKFRLFGDVFVDSTGLGTLGYQAGATYRIGTEGKQAFGEENAPEHDNGDTMGNTILFVAEDAGKPVTFTKPDWAYTFDESDFAHRGHGNVTTYHTPTEVVMITGDQPYDYDADPDVLVEKYDVNSGYWWIELGGDWDDIIAQAEDIRWELYRTVYGVWDHIKNGGDHGAENHELIWVGHVPGVRESRRFDGKYILTEQDILANRIFEDEVAYGGWPMDDHIAGGFAAKGEIPSVVRSFPGLYSIPLGCYISENIENLMITGRTISASKLAMGSTRIMGTCAVGGQAVGTAAAMATERSLLPYEFGKKHIKELQQALLKDDCYLLGTKNEDPSDHALKATVTASSYKKGGEPENVINGVARSVEEQSNLWVSDGMAKDGEVLTLQLDRAVTVSELRLTFDPNLSEERTISVSKAFKDREPIGVAQELVKEYTLTLFNSTEEVWQKKIEGNYQRHVITGVDAPVEADRLEVRVTATNGCEDARIFEVRIY